MASIDKAAIGITIAVVAIALGLVAVSDSAQSNPPTASAPTAPAPVAPAPVEEPAAQPDPFAGLTAEEEMEAEVEEMEAEVEMEAEEMMEAEEETMEEPSGPQTISVDMPPGTSVPGCEETNECFTPSSITINAGDTVEWTNSDTAAHTVTGGSPADGPSGVFDSSLVLGGAQYAFTFEEAGDYVYFCMVHPWMVGDVQVN